MYDRISYIKGFELCFNSTVYKIWVIDRRNIELGKKNAIKEPESEIDINNVIHGLAVGVTFLVISGFLYLNPSYLFMEIISYIIGTIVGVVGLISMLAVIGNIDKKFNDSLSYITFSILLGVIIYSIYFFASNIVVNIVVLLFSFLVVYMFLDGFFQIVYLVATEHNIKKSSVKISVFILNLLIFTLTVLQILQIFEVIK